MRKKTQRRRKSKNANQLFDIIGITLVFFGIVMLISLVTPDSSGVLGLWIKTSLMSLAGVGAYIFPFLCALVGTLFILGPITIWSRNAGIGSSMIFLSFLGWKGLAGLQVGGEAEAYGGIVGWAIASGTQAFAGMLISKALLGLVIALGVYITFDVPLALVIAWIRDISASGAKVARDRLIPATVHKGNGSKPPVKKNTEQPVHEEREEKKRLFPVLVRKDEIAEDTPKIKPDQRKIPVTISHGAKYTPTEETGGTEPSDSEEAEFRLPPLSLLAEPQPPPQRVEAELKSNVEVIERTLEEFKVSGDVVEIAHGPTITRYEIRLAPGIKVNKIVSLADNLAMSLAAIDVRVEAPIPGKSAIGVEVPNKNPAMVGLREVIDSDEFRSNPSKLLFALGKDVSGECEFADLTKMPHLLVAGSTNSGKSVCLNTLIASLLYRSTPDELKMILIDPKRVELSLFDGIPHLACPVVRDARQAAAIFRSATKEMDNRYDLIARAGCRNIQSYNEKQPDGGKLPYMVIVCDELADLMMQAAAEVETSICRIAQLARAVGIHLVIATQRPSVDVVTGLIKANISSRIAFAASSQVDSRTIIDQNGAERLIGRGDMLFLPIDAQKPMRVQGCYVSEDETHKVVDYLKSQRKPVYTIEATDITSSGGSGAADDGGISDPIYEQAIRMIVTTGYASTSMIQRKFKIGYTRAARLVDAMEQQGIVGPLDGSKPREILINKEDLERLLGGPTGLSNNDFYEEEEEE